MNLILNEDVQRLADARTKREMAAVLRTMPLWTMLVYRSAICQRLNSRGFTMAVGYVAAYAAAVKASRDVDGCWPDAVNGRITEAELVMGRAVALEDEEANAVEHVAGQALEAELSKTDL